MSWGMLQIINLCATKPLESDRVISEIKKITNELSIYQRYLQRFPTLFEIVQNLVKIKEKEIGLLKCELTAIKNMIEAC